MIDRRRNCAHVSLFSLAILDSHLACQHMFVAFAPTTSTASFLAAFSQWIRVIHASVIIIRNSVLTLKKPTSVRQGKWCSFSEVHFEWGTMTASFLRQTWQSLACIQLSRAKKMTSELDRAISEAFFVCRGDIVMRAAASLTLLMTGLITSSSAPIDHNSIRTHKICCRIPKMLCSWLFGRASLSRHTGWYWLAQ
jgi:hypothetical protein